MEKVHKTCLEMLNQRGYIITENTDEKLIGKRNESKVECKKKDEKICVILSNISKFNVDRVEECISFMNSINVKHSIVIYSDTATSTAKTMIEKLDDMKIELFGIDELQHNITKHKLCPEHIKLEQEEAEKFKKEYGLKFPTILKNDPISRFYGYQRGDVIKVIRKNGFITYRIVRG
jgi:DNA-directed RNA polymerase I, II, and III subunit RPABC1